MTPAEVSVQQESRDRVRGFFVLGVPAYPGVRDPCLSSVLRETEPRLWLPPLSLREYPFGASPDIARSGPPVGAAAAGEGYEHRHGAAVLLVGVAVLT